VAFEKCRGRHLYKTEIFLSLLGSCTHESPPLDARSSRSLPITIIDFLPSMFCMPERAPTVLRQGTPRDHAHNIDKPHVALNRAEFLKAQLKSGEYPSPSRNRAFP